MSILMADPPDWEDDPGGYEFTATIAGGIVLSGGEQFAEVGEAIDFLNLEPHIL